MYGEEPGGSRPDRLDGVRPQERVQRHTVEQIVDASPGLPMLDASVPLMVEQLVDVLAFVEAVEQEEEARMNGSEDLILKGAQVGAADVAAWRRWASGCGVGLRRCHHAATSSGGSRDGHSTGSSCIAGQIVVPSATGHGVCGGDSACAGAESGVDRWRRFPT